MLYNVRPGARVVAMHRTEETGRRWQLRCLNGGRSHAPRRESRSRRWERNRSDSWCSSAWRRYT